MARSLAPNSISTYQTGFNQFLAFCNRFSITPFPLAEHVLENFCVDICHRVSYKAIKVYLSGVQYFSKIQGFKELIEEMPRLEYLVTAIRRCQGNKFDRPTRPPVTLQMLHTICEVLTQVETPFNRDMLTAAVLVAFYGLLRVSEYTCPSQSSYDADTHLLLSDLSLNWGRRVVLLRIKKSKTDPFRQGVTIRIAFLNHLWCPVRALLRYIRRRGPAPGPLFIYQNGAYLTRAGVLAVLTRCLLHVQHINTHSFRRGGASALAMSNIPAHIIQILGRWKSNAYIDYIQLSDAFFVITQEKMSQRKGKGK